MRAVLNTIKKEYEIGMDKGQKMALLFGYDKRLNQLEGKNVNVEEFKKALSSSYGSETLGKEEAFSYKYSDEVDAILKSAENEEMVFDRVHNLLVSRFADRGELMSDRMLSNKSANIINNKPLFSEKNTNFLAYKKAIYDLEGFSKDMAKSTGISSEILLEKAKLQKPLFESVESAYLDELISFASEISAFCAEDEANILLSEQKAS